MKTCKKQKDITEFNKNKKSLDGLQHSCKECQRIKTKEYRKTKLGLITSIYSHQKEHSLTRKHLPPTYTKKQLIEWILSRENFNNIFNNWTNSGHNKKLSPSIDRIDNNFGYSLDNIKLTTWEENHRKARDDMRNKKLVHSSFFHGGHKSVVQYDKEGNFIGEYISTMEAERKTGVSNSHISSCCLGRYGRKTTGGFIWKYKNKVVV